MMNLQQKIVLGGSARLIENVLQQEGSLVTLWKGQRLHEEDWLFYSIDGSESQVQLRKIPAGSNCMILAIGMSAGRLKEQLQESSRATIFCLADEATCIRFLRACIYFIKYPSIIGLDWMDICELAFHSGDGTGYADKTRTIFCAAVSNLSQTCQNTPEYAWLSISNLEIESGLEEIEQIVTVVNQRMHPKQLSVNATYEGADDGQQNTVFWVE